MANTMNDTATAGGFWDDADLVSVYTRAQAIEDGVLVDVSEVAREAGIRFPVAVTRTLFDTRITPPKSNKIESVQGRLWDVLWMFSLATRRSSGAEILFRVIIGRKTETLKAVCSGGDDGAPVITISFPNED